MADTKISALTAVSAAVGTHEIPVNESGTTKKLTVNQLFTTPVQQSYEDFTAISDPSAPSAGVLRVYTKSIAGRMFPKWKGPSGLDTPFQAALFQNSITMWLPGVTTTAAINFGVSWTVGATQAHPAIATTNIMTSIKRATFTTTTTSGNAAGVRSAAAVAAVSTTAGLGGYFFAVRGGILTYDSAMQVQFGLTATNGALAGDPSAQNHSVGLTKDTGETVWQATTRDASAAEKTATGRTTAAGGTANVFDFYAFCAPGTTSPVTLRVVDITDGTVLVDNVAHSTHVPASGQVLFATAQVRTNAAVAVAIFLSKIYVECDN